MKGYRLRPTGGKHLGTWPDGPLVYEGYLTIDGVKPDRAWYGGVASGGQRKQEGSRVERRR